jgi:hypothetical protein
MKMLQQCFMSAGIFKCPVVDRCKGGVESGLERVEYFRLPVSQVFRNQALRRVYPA